MYIGLGLEHSLSGIHIKGQCKNEYLRRTPMSMIDGIVVGFCCDVISCELACRGVWRGAAEANGKGGVHRVWALYAVGLTSIIDRGKFSS